MGHFLCTFLSWVSDHLYCPKELGIFISFFSDHYFYYYCLALHILLSCSTATKVTPLTMKALLDMRVNPRKNTESPSLSTKTDNAFYCSILIFWMRMTCLAVCVMIPLMGLSEKVVFSWWIWCQWCCRWFWSWCWNGTSYMIVLLSLLYRNPKYRSTHLLYDCLTQSSVPL